MGPSDGDLDRWLAELRSRDAARARARTSWLRRQASEEGSLAGTLAELHDAARVVVIDTTVGHQHRGRVRLVGRDVCVVRTDQGTHVIIAIGAIASIRLPDARDATAGEGGRRGPVTMHEVLSALATDERDVQVVATGHREPLRGELQVVGTDVVGVRLDGRGAAYLPLASLVEVSVAESG